MVGVWIGRDDDKSLGKISGGTVPAKIWRDFMSSALAIEGRKGPPLPTSYRNRPKPDRELPDDRKSPLPEDWSDRLLRTIGKAIDEMIEE